jgi:hypothetical protein
VIMKKTRGNSADKGAVKIAMKAQTSRASTGPSAQGELTSGHAAFRQLLGQVADGIDSLQHHLNEFQHAVTATGRGGSTKDNSSKASKERGRAVQ